NRHQATPPSHPSPATTTSRHTRTCASAAAQPDAQSGSVRDAASHNRACAATRTQETASRQQGCPENARPDPTSSPDPQHAATPKAGETGETPNPTTRTADQPPQPARHPDSGCRTCADQP